MLISNRDDDDPKLVCMLRVPHDHCEVVLAAWLGQGYALLACSLPKLGLFGWLAWLTAWMDIQISLYESCQSHNGNDNGRSTTFSTLAADTMMLLPHCTAMCGPLAATQTHSLPTPLFYHFQPKLKYFTHFEHMGSKIENRLSL